METCLKSVSASYNPKQPTNYCVQGLSLTVGDKGVTALLGESGSGKTSILRLFAGFLRPSSGKVIVNGLEVASSTCYLPPEARKVGVLFQDYALFPHLNVSENILFGVSKKLSKAKRQDIMQNLLEACRLKALNLALRYPHELSGGQMQRVALARVLASQPQLLILDEPLNSVDQELCEQMLCHIRELVEYYQMRVLYITHDKNEAFQIANRLAIIRNGQLLQTGSARNLYEKPVNAYVARYLDKVNILPLCPSPDPQYWQSPIGPIPKAKAKAKDKAAVKDIGHNQSSPKNSPKDYPRSSQVSLCLRPEQLCFSTESSTESPTESLGTYGHTRIVEQRYCGSYREVYCRNEQFPEIKLIVRCKLSAPSYQSGAIVHIRPLLTEISTFHLLES